MEIIEVSTADVSTGDQPILQRFSTEIVHNLTGKRSNHELDHQNTLHNFLERQLSVSRSIHPCTRIYVTHISCAHSEEVEAHKLTFTSSSMLGSTQCGIVIFMASSTSSKDGWNWAEALKIVPSPDIKAHTFPPQHIPRVAQLLISG